ncbi:MAG: AmmeMemoRadiSam system protein B [Gammaproteobacteria bacterium]|nr:AmmeMemoRadiSam system protein B [Gammaproteobacteria bacterium]
MNTVRTPAVAGVFYPGDARELHEMLAKFLKEAEAGASGTVPKAIIAPHAGYVYSGPVAASIYARLIPARDTIHRVVLLGPSHRVAFQGLAASNAERFSTPLGEIPLDREGIDKIVSLPQVSLLDQAHAHEHSLEVHLPFLQEILDSFTLLPLVVGDAKPQEVGEVLAQVWGGPETLIVISSDLSHYLNYDEARKIDAQTSAAIENLRTEDIRHEQACGRNPIAGLLTVAKDRGMRVETVDVRNSGDTAGTKDRVVGYGSYAFN